MVKAQIGGYTYQDLRDVCETVATKFGGDAVIALCDSISHEVWWVCEVCHIETPHDDDPDGDKACLVCGWW